MVILNVSVCNFTSEKIYRNEKNIPFHNNPTQRNHLCSDSGVRYDFYTTAR